MSTKSSIITGISIGISVLLLILLVTQYYELQKFRDGTVITSLAEHEDEVMKLSTWKILNVHNENDVSLNQRLLMKVNVTSKWEYPALLYATIEISQSGKIIDIYDSTYSIDPQKERIIELPFFLKNLGPQDLKIELLFRNETNGHVFEQRIRHVTDLTVLSFQEKLLRDQNDTMFWSQIGIISGTVALVLVGVFTLRSSKNIQERKEKTEHSKILIPVYTSLLHVVVRPDYNEKKLSLVIPTDENDLKKIKSRLLGPKEIIRMKYAELDNFVEYIDWGLQHLHGGYSDIYEKWNKVEKLQLLYTEKVSEIEKNIEIKVRKKLEEIFPNLVESSGYSHASYSVSNIVRSIFNMLGDTSHGNEPDTHVNSSFYDEEKIWFFTKDGGTIFEGPEKIDFDESKMYDVLGCCFGDKQLEQKFLELDKFYTDANHLLDDMRPQLEKLLKLLKGGGSIKGKCELGY